jgi:two-component system, NtrC family, nitrogen regulation response regulator GlnG
MLDHATRREGGEDSTAKYGPQTVAPALAPVANLTVIAHPDPERVGARVSLAELGSGRAVALSRNAPRFGLPGARAIAALDDRGLSRTPIWFGAGEGRGAVRLRRGESSMAVLVDGEALAADRQVSAEEVARGVVILLGERVALVLHLGDAVPDWSGPRYGLVGESTRMQRLRRGIRQVAGLEVPVLVRGESGAGKELVAQAIHDASGRRGQPFVAVNMAAIPTALAAAELFGAARGAFTGAVEERAGYFSRAHGGTLFLDEIGEAAPEVQALLLRALETGEVQKVGSLEARRVDVRVIAATDADLQAQMDAGKFRAPLFHRLMAASLQVPPLRARREDLGRLLYGFLGEELGAAERGRLSADGAARPWLPAAVVARLAQLEWPGNVRQLRNCARAMVVAGQDAAEVSLDELGEVLEAERPGARRRGDTTWPAPSSAAPRERLDPPAQPAPAEREPAAPPAQRWCYRAASEVSEEELLETLRKHKWGMAATASALKISRTALYARIERCPRVRKGSELSAEEIERGLAEAGGDVDAAAMSLGVSRHALLLRRNELRARSAGRRADAAVAQKGS